MALINATTNLRNRMLLMTAYSAGLRLEELVFLKIGHIDGKRMVIRVVQGKGQKDRYTTLSKILIEELRQYWRAYKPDTWLFYTTDPKKPMSKSTVQKVFTNTKKRQGSNEAEAFTAYAIALPLICLKQATTFDVSKK